MVINENTKEGSQVTIINQEKPFHEEKTNYLQQKISMSEIGVQTSKEHEKVNLSRNVSHEDNEKCQNDKIGNLNKDSSIIKKLKKELEAAQIKIKELENEQSEAEKRRAIEISSKYVPTSFNR